MKILEKLSKTTIKSILTITLLVMSSLWIYEEFYLRIREEKKHELYHKLLEENQSLIYETQNLKAQNKVLLKVLELKENLE